MIDKRAERVQMIGSLFLFLMLASNQIWSPALNRIGAAVKGAARNEAVVKVAASATPEAVAVEEAESFDRAHLLAGGFELPEDDDSPGQAEWLPDGTWQVTAGP